MRLAVVLAALSLSSTPTLARAQALRPVSLDLMFGGGAGIGGGELDHRAAMTLDALLGARLGAAGRRATMIAVSAGVQAPLPHGDSCRISPTTGQCVGSFPILFPVAALVGWEGARGRGASSGATARGLVGPALVRLDGDDSGGWRGNTLGAQARADFATGQLGPLASVASARATLVPRFRGQTLLAWAIALGVRVR